MKYTIQIGDTRLVQDDNGDVFEFTATRQLSREEAQAKIAEREQEFRDEIASLLSGLSEVGGQSMVVLDTAASAMDGSNGHPQCAVCGTHHEGAFASLDAEIVTTYPVTESVWFNYPNTDALEDDVTPKLYLTERTTGRAIIEEEPELLDCSAEHEHGALIRKFVFEDATPAEKPVMTITIQPVPYPTVH
jgi:hypothetical protein